MMPHATPVAVWILTTRSLVRAPIFIYRHGLGRLLGPRILMLEHTGRRSGLPRYVCLEIVDRPTRTHLAVVSGFGTTAQWYQNLAHHPDCYVSTGKLTRVPATAVLLPPQESQAVLARYQRDHPAAWRTLSAALEQAVGHPANVLPVVELSLHLS